MIRKLKNIFHLGEAAVGHLVYRFPARKLKIIGVTGTDGKTTTTSLIYHILTKSGRKASMISTVAAKLGTKEYDTGFHVTTPGRHRIPKFLRASVDNGDEFFVLEITSHALDQNRAWGLSFVAGVITNITHEHLDYHKTYDNYVRAKAKLLLKSRTAIINHDDQSYPFLREVLDAAGKEFITYGIKQQSDVMVDIAKHFPPDMPEFNQYNYLAAYAVCREVGIADGDIFAAMKTYTLPVGRLDVVQADGVKVLIDFAHTPNSIDQLLKAVKGARDTKGRIIHVFGAAGLRDFTKRPLMGEASGAWADIVILTEEDYRTEDPVEIAETIAAGLKKRGFTLADDLNRSKEYTVIIDRADAIKRAITIARPNDIVVITGKGHEKSLCRGKTEYPWDDREAVVKEIDRKV